MPTTKSKSSRSSSRSSKSSTSSATAAPDVVSADAVSQVLSSPAPMATVSPQEGDRTAEEKQKALAKVSKLGAADKYRNKTLVELAAAGGESLQVAVIALIEALPRLLNVDFIHEATLAEVLSGEAADRAALSSDSESPQRVDDAILPAGTQATDDMLPPNLQPGKENAPSGFKDHPAFAEA